LEKMLLGNNVNQIHMLNEDFDIFGI
jgi:hypothetical protein